MSEAQDYALFLSDKKGSCLHPNVAPALKMDRNLKPIPWEHILFGLPSLHQILSCLLLHPTEWDRKTHFGELACGHACDCCRSRWMFFFEAGDGCSQQYARTCCTTCRSSTPHAAAETVQRAGWRWDGDVQEILGKDAIGQEDGSSVVV